MTKRNNPTQLRLEAKKPVPKMPEGYYSGDKPNSKLRAFVREHLKERPYDPQTDEYDIPAFNEPIKTTKATSIYNIHTYWAKKPHDAIRQYICHYTQPGDLVLDPFCGSGGTALAAIMEGRKAVAIDISPASTFITKGYCTPVDPYQARKAYLRVKGAVEKDVIRLYETTDRFGKTARINYTTWSETLRCHRCLEIFPLAEPSKQKNAKSFVKSRKACPFCSEPIPSRPKYFGMVPVRITYTSRNERRGSRDVFSHKEAFKPDVEKALTLFSTKTSLDKCLDHPFPMGTITRQPINAGFRKLSDIFTGRNLRTLINARKAILEEPDTEIRDFLLFCFEGIILTASKMYKEQTRNIQSGTYYCPPIMREVYPFNLFDYKLEQALRGVIEAHDSIRDYCLLISTEDAKSLPIDDESVDYIFTDPPYSGKVQFAEANYVWETFLGFDTGYWNSEIIVSDPRGIGRTEWRSNMLTAFRECFRVLKPGRFLSLCYHDSASGTWDSVQEIMADSGFVVGDDLDRTLFIEVAQKSLKQRTSSNVQKRDLVINFRKPKRGELSSAIKISGDEDDTTFREKVLTIIRDYLLVHPGTTKDRIHDEVVSRLVRKGRMQAFDFESVLAEIAESISEPVKKNLFELEDPNLFGTHEIKRWYLKEATDHVDEAEAVREDSAAAKLEVFMDNYLKEQPERDGVHYSYLLEVFVTIRNKPRREMADWLIDYFYKTEEGTWRPPMTDEEREEKAKQRATGALRKIKSFARLLESGAPIPERLQPQSDGENADWVHQARRAGLYHQGKVIFEKSGLNLSRLEEIDENLAIDVNEDYQYCLKQLGEG